MVTEVGDETMLGQIARKLSAEEEEEEEEKQQAESGEKRVKKKLFPKEED